MKIKINIDFDDDGSEDPCFQGWTLEADLRPGADRGLTEVALDDVCDLVYRMAGYAKEGYADEPSDQRGD